MSVDKLRQNFNTKGCQVVLWVIGVAVTVGMGIALFPSLFNKGQGAGGENDFVIAEVEGRTITDAQVQGLADAFYTQLGNTYSTGDPQIMFQALGTALTSAVESALMQQLAVKYGLETTDQALIAYIENSIDEQLEMTKAQLRFTDPDLGEDATEAQIVNMIEEQLGQSIADFKEQQIIEFRQRLAEPNVKEAVSAQYIADNLQSQISRTMTPADSDVREGATAYKVRSIFLTPNEDESREETLARAEQVKAALESGQAADSVAEEFTGTDSAPENTLTLDTLQGQPDLLPLLDLAEGEVSEPIRQGTGYTVFILDSITPISDDEWTQQRAMLLETYRTVRAQQQMEDELTELRDSVAIDWKSAGYKALYDTITYLTDAQMEGADLEAEPLRELADQAREAALDDPNGTIAATLARHRAFEELLTLAEGEARADLLEEWIEVLNETLSFTESTEVRLALADAYFEMGSNEDGAAELLSASQYNTDIEGISGMLANEDIRSKLEEAVEAGNVDAETEATIRAELKRWQDERDEYLAEEQRLQDELEQERLQNEQEAAAEAGGEGEGTGETSTEDDPAGE